MRISNTDARRVLLTTASMFVVSLACGGVAWGQEVPAPAAAEPASTVEEVVVTGYRASLQSALSLKRTSNVMVDAINAEDIADFPDANLAESLQRLPGVSIDRDNGEGRTISVRGRHRDLAILGQDLAALGDDLDAAFKFQRRGHAVLGVVGARKDQRPVALCHGGRL